MGQQAIHALAVGSIYALLMAGFGLMARLRRALPLGYASVYTGGGYLAWWSVRTTASLWSALGGVAGGAILLGLALAVRRLPARGGTPLASLLIGIGTLACVEEASRLLVGPYHMKVVAFASYRVFSLGPLLLSEVHWLVFGITFGVLTTAEGLLKSTKGRRWLAAALADEAGSGAGWPGLRRRLLLYGASLALGGLAGVLASCYFNDVHPAMGTAVTPRLLVLACLGALTSLQHACLLAAGLAATEHLLLPVLPWRLPADTVVLAAAVSVAMLRPWPGIPGVGQRG